MRFYINFFSDQICTIFNEVISKFMPLVKFQFDANLNKDFDYPKVGRILNMELV